MYFENENFVSFQIKFFAKTNTIQQQQKIIFVHSGLIFISLFFPCSLKRKHIFLFKKNLCSYPDVNTITLSYNLFLRWIIGVFFCIVVFHVKKCFYNEFLLKAYAFLILSLFSRQNL